MPRFRNGTPENPSFLKASDLNAISQNQAYIAQSLARANMLWEWMDRDDVRYMVHRSRYLHWVVDSTVGGAHLKFNGSTIATASSTSGVVDLVNLGLAQNQVYELVWADADGIFGTHLYEHPSITGSLVLPSSPPTFTSGADEDQLNAISTDTQYLLDNGILIPNLAFVSKIYPDNKPSVNRDYTGFHLQRYLYFSATVRHGGEPGDEDIFVTLKVNGTNVFFLQVDGTADHAGRFAYINTFIDLEGTDHFVGGYTLSGTDAGDVVIANGSSLGLSHAEKYHCVLRVEADTRSSEVQVYQIGEYPAQWVL